jgi:hypothetical protein
VLFCTLVLPEYLPTPIFSVIPTSQFGKIKVRFRCQTKSEKHTKILQYNVENVTIATFSKFLDHILDNILDDILNILNDHVPKYKNKKHKYPAWFTPQIIKNVQIKNKLRRRYMKFKNPEDLVSFRELRGSIKSDISLAYKEFVASSERNINENPKKFWQYLRQKRRGTGLPSCMSIGKSTIEI